MNQIHVEAKGVVTDIMVIKNIKWKKACRCKRKITLMEWHYNKTRVMTMGEEWEKINIKLEGVETEQVIS